LDASGGAVFLKSLDAAKGALNRAAASTQPLSRFAFLKTKQTSARLIAHSRHAAYAQTNLVVNNDAARSRSLVTENW
jgi:hypothetical protein